MTPARRKKLRRLSCRTAGRLGMTPEDLRQFYRGQQILVNEMRLQRILRHHGEPYLVGMDFGFHPGQAVVSPIRPGEDELKIIDASL